MNNIVVINDKGGASKSTVSFQAVATFFLNKNKDCTVFEFDDENKDTKNFTESKIKTQTVEVGDSHSLKDSLREICLNKKNNIFDVGGNKSTILFLNGLKTTRMYKKISLYIIPVSGGSQDIVNGKKVVEKIRKLNPEANIIFALSRVRNPKRIKFQYSDFFKDSLISELDYFSIKDSDVVDLSRKLKKSAFELSIDKSTRNKMEEKFDKVLDLDDADEISLISIQLELFDECDEFVLECLSPAFDILSKHISLSLENPKKAK